MTTDWNAALEAAAKVCDMDSATLMLHAGDMSVKEIRTSLAVVAYIGRAILALRRDETVSDEPRIILRVVMYSMPESNGKRNWTAMFKRTTKFDGLVGNCGGVLIDRGECWNRVAYEAERARVLTGERISEPDIMEYAIDVNTPDEWQGNDPESLIMIKPAHTPNASAEMKRDAARYRRLREQERRRFDNEYKRT